jgi:AAA domain
VTIDVATRFPRTTLREAYELSKQTERWVFPETICSSVTLLYGRSGAGKSWLVASMLLALLINGREFLGMQPTDPNKIWKPAILWTDPGSNQEYAERMHLHGVEVDTFYIGMTTWAAEWKALAEHLLAEGYNFVVLDNLMGATGDTNDAKAQTIVFDGLTILTSQGVPVVVIDHETEKGKITLGATPMGRGVAIQKSRMWIQVRKTAKRQLRGGNTALIIQGNALPRPMQIVAETLAGPDYHVLKHLPWDSTDQNDDKPEPAPLDDKNAQIAAWVVNNCQGAGLNATAEKIAAEFGLGVDTRRQHLMKNGCLGKLLRRTGDGNAAVWRRA